MNNEVISTFDVQYSLFDILWVASFRTTICRPLRRTLVRSVRYSPILSQHWSIRYAQRGEGIKLIVEILFASLWQKKLKR